MLNRPLAAGYYDTTDSFRAIPHHCCVYFEDDDTLVAVTGPAHDQESQAYAQLFAAAPALMTLAEEIAAWLIAPDTSQETLTYFANKSRAAIAQAKGQ